MDSYYDEMLRKLEAGFVPADDAFWNDPSIVMGSAEERISKLFETLKRSSRKWETPGQCMYRGCEKTSIRRSHAIHRAGSIERIAEGQHVLTPRRNNHGQLRMERVGVNMASTFPGFCEEHEGLFFDFESTGALSSPRHVALQAFRTLCREIVRKRQGLSEVDGLVQSYREARRDYYAGSMQKVLPGASLEDLMIEGDPVEKRIAWATRGGRSDLAELEGDLYSELFSYVSGQSKNEPLLHALSLPFEVPVCCSGFGVLTYQYDEARFRALCPLGILPQEGSTVIFIGAARKHRAVIDKYVGDLQFGFCALNAMESWLTNGSDHWFIRPSSWSRISPTRQAKVIDLLERDDDNIATFLNFSVLDDARIHLIGLIRDNLSSADDREGVLRMAESEEAKLLE